MGREIEMKIPLTEDKYNSLIQVFCEQKSQIEGIKILKACPETVFKRDEYWSRYDSREERLEHKEPQVIRIRTEEKNGKNEVFFTLKHKTKQNGIELNKEDETYIENPEVLRLFFIEAGYHKWFDKVKKNAGAFCHSSVLPGVEFHVELEDVNGLKYIEVEVTSEEGDAQIIKSALGDFMKQCGLNPEYRDYRSWVEILSNR